MEEIWKDIPNFSGYQASNLGRIRTHNKVTSNSLHPHREWKDRILKYKCKSKKVGYTVDLWKEGKPRTRLVARLVAFTFYGGDIESRELTVNHIDGNRLNNELANLELVSLKENIQHGFRTGLYSTTKKVKVIDKITGTIIFPSSLSEGGRLIGQHHGYLGQKIKKGVFENERYKWELL